jgi:hypothetical protein
VVRGEEYGCKRAFRERLETTIKEFYEISSKGGEDKLIRLSHWFSSVRGNQRTMPFNKVLEL